MDNDAWQKQMEEAEQRYFIAILSNHHIPRDDRERVIQGIKRMVGTLRPRDPRPQE
jgi:hypothetical protein